MQFKKVSMSVINVFNSKEDLIGSLKYCPRLWCWLFEFAKLNQIAPNILASDELLVLAEELLEISKYIDAETRKVFSLSIIAGFEWADMGLSGCVSVTDPEGKFYIAYDKKDNILEYSSFESEDENCDVEAAVSVEFKGIETINSVFEKTSHIPFSKSAKAIFTQAVLFKNLKG
jgi:hypothetical protein